VVGGAVCGGFGTRWAGGVWVVFLGDETEVRRGGVALWTKNAKPMARVVVIHIRSVSEGCSLRSTGSGFRKTR
jgi:hypothetical protein